LFIAVTWHAAGECNGFLSAVSCDSWGCIRSRFSSASGWNAKAIVELACVSQKNIFLPPNRYSFHVGGAEHGWAREERGVPMGHPSHSICNDQTTLFAVSWKRPRQGRKLDIRDGTSDGQARSLEQSVRSLFEGEGSPGLRSSTDECCRLVSFFIGW
jgi:hypothetical protein